MARRNRLLLTDAQLDLLDDVVSYYRASGMGGGDHDTYEDRRRLGAIASQIEVVRTDLAEDTGWPSTDRANVIAARDLLDQWLEADK